MATIIARRRLEGVPEALAVGLVALVACVLAAAILTDGSSAAVIVAGAALCIAAIIQPRYGLYAAMTIVLCTPLAGNPGFGKHLAQLGEPIPGAWFLPPELMIVCASIGVARVLVFERGASFRGGELVLPLVAFLATIGLAFGYGMMRGGNRDVALWETRSMFFVLPTFLVATNVLRTRAHIEQLSHVFVAVTMVLSVEALYRHFEYIRPGYQLDVSMDLAFAHEASIFVGLLALYFLSRMLWSSTLTGGILYGLASLVPLAALMIMKRRAGIVALDVSLIMMAIAFFRHDVTRFLIVVPIAAACLVAMLALTWNEPGGLGGPAQGIRTISESRSNSQAENADDQASDEYRRNETANIRSNILARPVLGLGFGKPYDMPRYLPDLSSFWPMFRYIPHNSVLWVWMKAGILGFVALLILFGAAVMRSAQMFRTFAGDPLQAAALVGGMGVTMFAVFAYVDLGLASHLATAFFGVSLGVIGALSNIARDEGLDAELDEGAPS